MSLEATQREAIQGLLASEGIVPEGRLMSRAFQNGGSL